MAYVSGFKHDVFISYAQVAEPEWVKGFLGQLQKHLDRELHQAGASFIFWDRHDLDGDSPLTAEITQSISSTATLVIVLSNAYLDRSWCRKEREAFFTQVGVDSRRAFLVLLEDVPLEKRPPEIKAMDVLGYRFWEPHPDTEKKGIIHPLPIGDEGPFDARIRELAIGLKERLKELKVNPPSLSASGAGVLRPRLNGTKAFIADGIDGKRVEQLQKDRCQLRNWLADQRVVVVPEPPGSLYEQFILASQGDDSQRKECASEAEKLMQDSTVCMQLLGAIGDQDGYESWLCDRAKAVGKTPGKDLLLWRPKSLELAHIKSDSHRALVFSAELQVIACDLNEFEKQVADHLERIERDREAQLRINASLKITGTDDTGLPKQCVLIDAASEDQQLIENFRKALSSLGIEYEPAQNAVDFEEMARSGAFDGVAFTFGQCDEGWINQRLKATRPFRLAARPGQRPRVGVYRDLSGRELTGTKGVDVMVDGVPESITQFVAKLKEAAR